MSGKPRQRRKAKSDKGTPVIEVASSPRRWVVPFLIGCVSTGIFGTLLAMEVAKHPRPQPLAIQPERSSEPNPPTLPALLAMSDEQLASEDLGLMNLRCADGLPGAEQLDVTQCLTTLDEWAKRIKFETDRHLYRVRDPQYSKLYKNSEAYFRVSMMVQVLQEDLGVHYNKQRVDEVDFTKSEDLFIHGLVGSTNGGTCVSLPVLYTAMGRRLGYPIKLVLTRGHVFCRWDGPKTRFNIEGSGEGFASFDDEYYTTWPHKLSKQQVEAGQFLKSLTPREELAVFLSARGHCLEDTGKFAECLVAYSQANALVPENPVYLHFLSSAMVRPHLAELRAEKIRRENLAYVQRANAASNARMQQAFQLPNSGMFHQAGYQPSTQWDSDPMTNSIDNWPANPAGRVPSTYRPGMPAQAGIPPTTTPGMPGF